MSKVRDELKIEILEAIKGIQSSYIQLGKALLKAQELLPYKDYQSLLAEIRLERDIPQAVFDAALKISEGKLDERLFAAGGVKVSKIVHLSKTDQARLLSPEKFPIKQADGTKTEKRWAEMDKIERNVLLGDKGGHILPPDNQSWPVSGDRDVSVKYDVVDYHKKTLILTTGTKVGKVALGVIGQQLNQEGLLELFIADLQAYRNQMAEEEDVPLPIAKRPKDAIVSRS
jgi:hypothetical protein